MSRLAVFGGSAVRTKPFPSWPIFDESEEKAVLEVLRSGKWWRYSYGEGVEFNEPAAGRPRSKVADFEEAFARFQGARFGVACANGTAAIEIALRALGVGPGDEVIVPAYTFVATASAPLMVNGVPIFCDIDCDTLNLDPKKLEEAITPRTKAIIPVHFAGQAADMEAILRIARRHRLFVLEDAAHAHGAKWNDRGLGTIGNAGTFSFQASKNMTAGEGGLIVTDDPALSALCESYLGAGRTVGRPWYEHYRLGWNYRLTEFQGAILLQQLKRLAKQNAKRMENGLYLNRRLSEIPGILPLKVPSYVTKHSFHIYVFRFSQEEFGISREDFLSALEKEGIPCSGGYPYPLYQNPMFLNQDFYPHGCPLSCGVYDGTVEYASFADLCPNAERACREVVWLEQRELLAEREDVDDIVRSIAKIHECRKDLQRAGDGR